MLSSNCHFHVIPGHEDYLQVRAHAHTGLVVNTVLVFNALSFFYLSCLFISLPVCLSLQRTVCFRCRCYVLTCGWYIHTHSSLVCPPPSRFTAGGNIATTLTVLALILSGFFLHRAMQTGEIALPPGSEGEGEGEEELLDYVGFSAKGVPVSLGVMAYCKLSEAECSVV